MTQTIIVNMAHAHTHTHTYIYTYAGFQGGTSGKEPACHCRRCKRQGSIPGSEEEGMAIHSSILAWRIPWTEEPGRPQSIVQQSQTWLKWLNMHAYIHTYTFIHLYTYVYMCIYVNIYLNFWPHHLAYGTNFLTRDWNCAPLHLNHWTLGKLQIWYI